ncbi:ABC transporter ATP-binding protein [Micromonospora profundi]|uniref:ABC transporter ATP-binding protein n=1 Tax=Micromonospora TaxID=1873 RepID=UPI001438B397|nr:ABC transporter ATP-binding protein [Micromonospora profundi]NJC12928.1 ATP-binding cassette subfamily B protein [Micromonospora profundi]
MALRDPGSRRSMPANIAGALQLSWLASRSLFSFVLIVLPVLEGLLGVGLLLIFRGGAGVFLTSTSMARPSLGPLLPWLVGAVLVTVLVQFLNNLRYTLEELLLERVRQFSAVRMHQAIGSLELADFDDPIVHDRISRAETTADYKPRQVVRGVTGLVASIFQILAVAALLVVLEPLLLPIMLIAAAPIMLISSALAGDRFSYFQNITPLERRRRYLGQLIIGRQPAAEGRSFRLTGHFAEQYRQLSVERYAELRQMMARQWRKHALSQITVGLVLSVAIATLAWFYTTRSMDTATLLTTIFALSRLAAAVGGLGGPIAELSEAGLFLGDQQAFYDQVEQAKTSRNSEQRPEPLRRLEVRDVTFAYPGGDRTALDGVSLTIRAGELIAFVGPNGSGKTTLAKILAFLYEPADGTVRWNDVDTGDLDREGLRDRVTAVFQDHMTYHFSIADNVGLGDIGRDRDNGRLRESLAAAGADDLVGSLRQGIDTALGPEFGDGTSLSGGELQRLAIARAVYRDRELVIMDEPTSALDAHADHALLRGLREVLRGKTSILVSHRFSNVRDADQIFVFDAGRIVERGTHDSLMAAGGLYAEMYTLQASAYQVTPTAGTVS